MCKVWGLKPNLESAWIWPGWLTNDLHCVSWSFLMWVLSFCLSPASWGRGLWPQWRRPGRRLRQGRVMSPSRLAWLELVWSGPVWFSSAWPASLLLWTNGKHGRPVTEILQKRHMRDTCSFSHLYGSHGDRKEKGGVGGLIPWSELWVTYLLKRTEESAYLHSHHQLTGGRRNPVSPTVFQSYQI